MVVLLGNPRLLEVSPKSCTEMTAWEDLSYYEILQLPRDCTPEDIKKAYRKAALAWHPDKNPDNVEEADRVFKLIAEAYEVLSDPEKREVYDNYGKEGLKQAQDYGGDYGGEHADIPGFSPYYFHSARDIFRDVFGTDDPFADMFRVGDRGPDFGGAFKPSFGGGIGSGFSSSGFDAVLGPGVGGSGFSSSGFSGSGYSSSGFSGGGFGSGLSSEFRSLDSGFGSATPAYGHTGASRVTSTSTRVVNGKRVVTKTTIEGGIKTVVVNGEVVSRTVSGDSALEGPREAHPASKKSKGKRKK